MDLAVFARMVVRRGWIVILLGLLGAAAGYAFATTRTPVYEAVTPVRVQPARPADLGQTNAIKEVMRSYQRDIKTYDMAGAVRLRLCDDPAPVSQRLCETREDAGAVRAMVHVGMDPNVFEIQIKARATEPDEAAKVSEQVAHAFVDQQEKANRQLLLADRILTQVRDDTRLGLYSPRTKLLVGLGGALGVLVGAVLVLLLEYLERAVVRDAPDAEAIVRATVVGVVPPGAGQRRAAGPLRRSLGELLSAAPTLVRILMPILLLAVVGAAAALAFSRAQPATYVARTRIAVEPALGSDWGRSQAIREIMRGFSRDITTHQMAAGVSERGQLDRPTDDLLEAVNVAEDVDVYEITVEVLDPDPQQAEEISRTWAELFVEQRRIANQELDHRDRVLTRLRDRPEVSLWAPKTGANVLAGAVLGAMVGAAVVFLLRFVRSGVVQSPADAGRATGAPLLGAIPPAGRRRRTREDPA